MNRVLPPEFDSALETAARVTAEQQFNQYLNSPTEGSFSPIRRVWVHDVIAVVAGVAGGAANPKEPDGLLDALAGETFVKASFTPTHILLNVAQWRLTRLAHVPKMSVA